MKKYILDFFACLVIVLTVGVFFFRLFYPQPQLLVTPDFGGSDAWHASFPMKYALWEAIHEKRLPLWNSYIGDGFPLFAEGQVGALFLPNLFLFSLPNPVVAYNLALLFSIVTLALGTYFLLRTFELSPLASLFGGLTLALSGLSVTHLTHITLLQGISLFPILLGLTHRMIVKGPFPWILVWGLVGSQQLFTGFPQGIFITILFCSSYVLWHAYHTRRWIPIVYIIASIVLAIGGGSVQLLPSFEFLKASQFPDGFDPRISSYFSFPLKHLITFINPFALGNPKFGTYPHFLQFDGSVFWENIGYIGVLPLGLASLAIMRIRQDAASRFFALAGISGLVLAWGSNSPLYFIYAIWPMTLFRVPSRFLWFVLLALVFLASRALDQIRKNAKPIVWYPIVGILIIAHVAQIMSTWWSYHLLVPANDWLQKPRSLQGQREGRVYTIGAAVTYENIFNRQGWRDGQLYKSLEIGVFPDINLIWRQSQHGVKAGRYLLRPSILDEFLSHSIQTDQNQATISATAQALLNRFSVRTILSFFPLTQEGLTEKETFSSNGVTLRRYDNPEAFPRAYLTSQATSAATLSQATYILSQPSQVVLLEDHEVNDNPMLQLFLKLETTPTGKLPIPVFKNNGHEYLELSVENPLRARLLVLTDTYYPGWKAFIDGVETPIYIANLSQRVILVPKGNHTITFLYQPDSLSTGLTISAIFYLLIIIGLAAFPVSFSLVGRFRKALLPSRRRPGNRGR